MTEHFVYGIHSVMALLKNPQREILQLFVKEDRDDQRIQEILQRASARNIPVQAMSLQKMEQRFAEGTHQGIVAQTKPLPEYTEQSLPALMQNLRSQALILILDGITDPHNLGAAIRSADASGVDFVIIPKDNSAGITATVSKVASGALESIPLVRVTNLARAMNTIKQMGVWIYGAAVEAEETIYDLDLIGSVAIVLGAEGTGLRRLTRLHCDGLFSLPMLGQVESLNVSVACGVALYEAVRQRR